MCGIAGKLYLDGQQPVDPQLIQRMTDVIAHRGPDGEGKYVSGSMGLGHRRLSIIDLRTTGAQPMCNEDETVWIVFNGEIYNFPELRDRLIKRGHSFRSATDTEVIVHLYEELGVDCLQHLRGMFAFAIWDSKERTLFMARDRVGIKPLYYCQTANALIFGSEIKSLLRDPEVQRQVNPQAVDRFLTYFYLPGNETLLKGIFKLEPGHYLFAKEGRVTSKQYWDLQYSSGETWRDIDEASDALNDLLRQTVKDHMISDVPVGFLASGGVDSTALLSYAVEETDKTIKTFTVGFDGEGFADERPYARLASKRFGTAHYDISMSAEDFRTFLEGFTWHMEEPVCEPPAIALYYVSKLARQHVKVLLSGEGGDEAFGGYPEYRNYLAFESCKALTGPFRALAGAALRQASRLGRLKRLEKYSAFVNFELPDYFYSRVASPRDYFNRSKSSLYTNDFASITQNSRPENLTRQLFDRVRTQHKLNQMLYVDTKTWLPDDLLIKADKITMATSLELRVPFLDHKILEFAATLPPDFKVKGRQTKRVLKRAFQSRVPKEILARRKTGFPVPFGRWLNHDLRGFVSETLLSSRAASRGYFQREGVRRLLDPCEGNGTFASETFSLLILELWHRQFVDGEDFALPSN
ncbi:MAG TPA: asparagine synthase (glutamine-hydrolyzing) [Terrimicrobiaceae bacterium]